MKLKPILEELFGTISEASLSRLLSKVKTNDFAIISAFRYGNSLKQNRQLNAQLFQTINAKKMGGYALIGHWAEAPDDVDYEDATPDQLTDIVEESVLFIRPTNLSVDEFISFAVETGKKYNQDAVIIGLNEKGIFLYYDNGKIVNIGSDISLNKTAKAYSQMRKKKNIPFVFEGVRYPVNNIGRQAFTLQNIKYI
jgi:hypothetical protein